MRRMGIGVGTFLLTALAAAFTLCPAGAWLAARQQDARTLEHLESQVSALDPGALKMRENVAKWYNLTFRQQDLSEIYSTVLDFGGGVLGALEIPALGLYLPIYCAGGSGVTHDAATALPIGGIGNTSALLGLGDISGLPQGALVYLHILGEIHVYQAGGQGSDRLVLYGKNRTGQAVSVTCTRRDTAPEQTQERDAAPAVKAALAAALGTGGTLETGRIILLKLRKNKDKTHFPAKNTGKSVP